MRIFSNLAIVAALLIGVVGSLAQETTTRIVIVGDSTVCDYPTESPCRGWGQFIQGYFKDGVRVTNLATSGRSTKTFIAEGRWKKAMDEKPQYVLIQFGHNDSHGAGKPESTDAATDFKANLRTYIEESRKIGATPVLVTPMHRRTFNSEGKLTDILEPYAISMKEVGTELKVPVIDLHGMTGPIFQQMGPDESQSLANAPKDRTHFNEKGAKLMANLVMKALPDAAPPLRALLKPDGKD